MAEHSDDQLLAETDKLVGRWECYAGDGIHGWDDRVIIFDKFGSQLTVEQSIPAPPGAPRQWGPYVARCKRGQQGLELTIDDGGGDGDGDDQSLWHVQPSADTLVLWQTGVDLVTCPRYNSYRRIGRR